MKDEVNTAKAMDGYFKEMYKNVSKEITAAYLRWLDLTTEGKRWPKGHPND